MDIETLFIDEKRRDFKCFQELRRLSKENENFRQTLVEGYLNGKITGFTEEIWKKIQEQNIRRIPSFEDVFRDGANIGYCTVAAKQLSYSFDRCYLCGGVLPILKGSVNCEDGSHTWLEVQNKIIDTTLMLILDKEYSEKIGFVEQNRYNPNLDPVYVAAKEFTRDKSISKSYNTQRNYDLKNLETIFYIKHNLKEIESEPNNLQIQTNGAQIYVKDETSGDYVMFEPNLERINIYPSCNSYSFKIDTANALYFVDDHPYSKDEFEQLLKEHVKPMKL